MLKGALTNRKCETGLITLLGGSKFPYFNLGQAEALLEGLEAAQHCMMYMYIPGCHHKPHLRYILEHLIITTKN